MKFYGTMICPDCLKAREMLPAAGVEFEYVDITVSTKNMKEFLALRDTRAEFAQVRAEGRIGIPCVRESLVVIAVQIVKGVYPVIGVGVDRRVRCIRCALRIRALVRDLSIRIRRCIGLTGRLRVLRCIIRA